MEQNIEIPGLQESVKEKRQDLILYSPVAGSQARNVAVWLFIALVVLAYATFLAFGPQMLGLILIVFGIAAFLALILRLAYPWFLKMFAGRLSIEVSDEGLRFPSLFGPDLLFRNFRRWDDIANILMGSRLLDYGKSSYEYEMETPGSDQRIFIYFKSGGHAALDLKRMSKSGQTKLFVAIESFCLDFSRSPIASSEEESDAQPKLEKFELPQSYTEIWEQELQDSFSSTKFVPLAKGSFLQEGKFRIVMPLSSGGMSAVYLASTRDRELRVIKEAVLPARISDEKELKAKELFKREVALLQKLSHPQIASVLDYFVENDRNYLVLEFVAGNSLRQHVAQNGPVEEKAALELTSQTATILEYLHGLTPPVIHRDISPDNLVLKEDNTLVLIDFGAANEFVGTATGTMVGKQAYIAPEQFKGKAKTASDLYALGGTLYFLLTGRDPEALTCSRPRDLNREISPLADDLVAGLTDLDLESRIATAAETKAKIEEIIEQGGGHVIDLK